MFSLFLKEINTFVKPNQIILPLDVKVVMCSLELNLK